jgi:hypothetical protein
VLAFPEYLPSGRASHPNWTAKSWTARSWAELRPVARGLKSTRRLRKRRSTLFSETSSPVGEIFGNLLPVAQNTDSWQPAMVARELP